MKQDEFKALMKVVEALIDQQLSRDHGRDWGPESLHLYDVTKEFVEQFCET